MQEIPRPSWGESSILTRANYFRLTGLSAVAPSLDHPRQGLRSLAACRRSRSRQPLLRTCEGVRAVFEASPRPGAQRFPRAERRVLFGAGGRDVLPSRSERERQEHALPDPLHADAANLRFGA